MIATTAHPNPNRPPRDRLHARRRPAARTADAPTRPTRSPLAFACPLARVRGRCAAARGEVRGAREANARASSVSDARTARVSLSSRARERGGARVMLTFCPTCANLLLLDREGGGSGGGGVRLRCSACAYSYDVVDGVRQRVMTAKKTVDDVLGGDEAWRNVDKTATTCPKCEHGEAYFMQIQIRSADEPMSVFYKCCECAHQWREG